MKNFPVDSVSYKQYFLAKYNDGETQSLLDLFESSGKTSLENFIDEILTKRPNNDCGDLMYENEQVHGFPTWREYVKKNWGLGNNASYGSNMFNINTISLSTFYKYPKPIIKKLSQMFPDDLIEIKYASDTPGEYVKSFKMINGQIVSNEKIDDKRHVYCELFKKDPNMFTDIKRKESINKIIYHVEETIE